LLSIGRCDHVRAFITGCEIPAAADGVIAEGSPLTGANFGCVHYTPRSYIPCGECGGHGATDLSDPCDVCNGRGYVPEKRDPVHPKIHIEATTNAGELTRALREVTGRKQREPGFWRMLGGRVREWLFDRGLVRERLSARTKREALARILGYEANTDAGCPHLSIEVTHRFPDGKP
jgi:hypothetical protein